MNSTPDNSTIYPIVASLLWDKDEQHDAQRDTVRELGYSCEEFYFDQPIPEEANVILVQGPYGPLLPFINRLQQIPKNNRPIFCYWFQQNLNFALPKFIFNHGGDLFSSLVNESRQASVVTSSLRKIMPDFFSNRGSTIANIGDIIWLHRQGLLDVFALSSSVFANFFKGYGIPSLIIPRGYDPRYGKNLNLERDISVVWMGKIRNRRRREKVYSLRDQLDRRGFSMQIFDGINNPLIRGENRTQILNRAWFVANIYANLTDEISIRFLISAANGAVVITEPSYNNYPFISGQHLVECPVEEMPDRIGHYLEHTNEWKKISEAMLKLVTEELTLKRSISAILDRAAMILNQRDQSNR